MIYEVRVTVVASRAHEWREWIEPHVDAILNTGCFFAARIEESVESAPQTQEFVIRYSFHGVADMERYEQHFAPQLRADGMQRFGNDITIRRSILREIAFHTR